MKRQWHIPNYVAPIHYSIHCAWLLPCAGFSSHCAWLPLCPASSCARQWEPGGRGQATRGAGGATSFGASRSGADTRAARRAAAGTRGRRGDGLRRGGMAAAAAMAPLLLNDVLRHRARAAADGARTEASGGHVQGVSIQIDVYIESLSFCFFLFILFQSSLSRRQFCSLSNRFRFALLREDRGPCVC